jgi:transposase
MVYHSISQDVKERALWLIVHKYVPDDICELFDISERSLRRWQEHHRVHGSVKPPINPNRGRPRILNHNMTHDLYTLLKEAPELYLDEIQDWIALAFQTSVSKSTLFRNIRDAGVTYKLLGKAAAERDEDARQEWKDNINTHFVASQMVFVDETSKDDRTIYRHYGRAVSEQQATIRANFVRGDRYSMVAALSMEGYEALRVVQGSVDGKEFLEFIIYDVVRSPPFSTVNYLPLPYSYRR